MIIKVHPNDDTEKTAYFWHNIFQGPQSYLVPSLYIDFHASQLFNPLKRKKRTVSHILRPSTSTPPGPANWSASLPPPSLPFSAKSSTI